MPSIIEKLERKGLEISVSNIENELNDIAGIRIVCSFIEDVYKLADELTAENVTKYTLQKYRTFDQDKNPPMQSEVDSFFNDENLICFLKKTFPKLSCR